MMTKRKKCLCMVILINKDWTTESEDNMTNSEVSEDEVNVQRPRKLLTQKWLVHDIDDALDENNHDSFHFVNDQRKRETLTSYLAPKKDKNAKTITWASDFSFQGWHWTYDVIFCGDNPRIHCYIKNSFHLVLSNDMFYLLVHEKNVLITKKFKILSSNKKHLFDNNTHMCAKHRV